MTPHFDDVVRLFWPRTFEFVLSSVRDKDLAADLTQDCFWRAYQGWPNFRGDSTVPTWLRHIALNVIRNSARDKRLQVCRCASSIDTIDEGCLIDAKIRCPEENAVLQSTVRAVWKAAEHVSPKQRRALQLRFVEDMDLLEVARVMGVTEGTVKVHLFRAIQSIRVALHVSSSQ